MDLAGVALAGTWTLEIENSGGQSGSIDSWSLLVEKEVDPPTVRRGDIDGNGVLEPHDHALLLFYINDWFPALTCLEAYDVDANGVIEPADIAAWLQLQANDPMPPCTVQDAVPGEDEIGCAVSPCP